MRFIATTEQETKLRKKLLKWAEKYPQHGFTVTMVYLPFEGANFTISHPVVIIDNPSAFNAHNALWVLDYDFALDPTDCIVTHYEITWFRNFYT